MVLSNYSGSSAAILSLLLLLQACLGIPPKASAQTCLGGACYDSGTGNSGPDSTECPTCPKLIGTPSTGVSGTGPRHHNSVPVTRKCLTCSETGIRSLDSASENLRANRDDLHDVMSDMFGPRGREARRSPTPGVARQANRASAPVKEVDTTASLRPTAVPSIAMQAEITTPHPSQNGSSIDLF